MMSKRILDCREPSFLSMYRKLLVHLDRVSALNSINEQANRRCLECDNDRCLASCLVAVWS